MSDSDLQRDYYRRTAGSYDAMHLDGDPEHRMALGWLGSLIELYGFRSLVDIGSGTGRVLAYLRDRHGVDATGVEPVEELRRIGIENGLAADRLIDGDATGLVFADDSFDIATEFAALHHIKDHGAAVSEMCRVARRGVFLSDCNNFGQGAKGRRRVKQLIDAVGLWAVYDRIATRGKGYHWSEGDGLFYSYSIFRDVPLLRQKFPYVHFLTTKPADGSDLYRSAPHIAVFASRDEAPPEP